jgi:hypothetical protein
MRPVGVFLIIFGWIGFADSLSALMPLFRTRSLLDGTYSPALPWAAISIMMLVLGRSLLRRASKGWAPATTGEPPTPPAR